MDHCPLLDALRPALGWRAHISADLSNGRLIGSCPLHHSNGGTSEDGRVSIALSGNQQPLSVKIEDSLLKEEKGIIENTILEAIKTAHKNSTDNMKNRMQELTGGLNLPGLGLNDES